MNFILATITGILSGFGIGGGTLLILVMTNFLGVPQLSAQGINLLYFLPTAGASLVGHIKNKLVNLRTFLWCAIPGFFVTVLSSLLTTRIDEQISRKLFGIFLLFIGFNEVFGKKKS